MNDSAAVSEVAIVDTFTKLIFGEQADFSTRELSIIQALRLVESRLDMDCHRDLGTYLRALGVAEMITLVGAVRGHMTQAAGLLAPVRSDCADNRSHPS